MTFDPSTNINHYHTSPEPKNNISTRPKRRKSAIFKHFFSSLLSGTTIVLDNFFFFYPGKTY
jgi:hypothetical protein